MERPLIWAHTHSGWMFVKRMLYPIMPLPHLKTLSLLLPEFNKALIKKECSTIADNLPDYKSQCKYCPFSLSLTHDLLLFLIAPVSFSLPLSLFFMSIRNECIGEKLDPEKAVLKWGSSCSPFANNTLALTWALKGQIIATRKHLLAQTLNLNKGDDQAAPERKRMEGKGRVSLCYPFFLGISRTFISLKLS